uniref:NADH-ubiquinone oxidoreductase chain 2 n=1 Tax=Scaphidium quadrimaculatum TaxID=295644 RepID=A0A0S2M865_SCAQU|nr:NADH dehydrogenase subunit 2 [Scaphidium quadrimaculatum]ALO70884.1 NADH deshydrogenase subunit 2 [Scaphidium quadrimaculatum]
MLFTSSLIMGSVIAISSNSWLGMWLGLEINLLSIIPLMNNSLNPLSSEASMKYFVTQAIASSFILMTIIFMSLNFLIPKSMESSLMMIFNTGILTKMGAAPFHFWFPEVMEGLSWLNCLIFLTWQKVAPMILLFYNLNNLFFSFIIMSCLLISGIMGLNQVSLRKILAYSSINHIGWMISAMLVQETIWMIYFLIYSILSIILVMFFKFFNFSILQQLFSSLTKNLSLKMFFSMNFLSLAGMPPFFGFIPKWLTIQLLIFNQYYLITFVMLISTLMTIFYYTRTIFSSLMINFTQINFVKKNQPKNFWLNFLNFFNLMSLFSYSLIADFL